MTHILTKRIFSSAIGVVALVAIFVGINILAKAVYVRTDITQDRQYSLSRGTLNILKDLPEDVTIKFFYSDSMPEQDTFIRAYSERVKDILREYENNGGGSLKVEMIDPKPYSDEQEAAQKYGVAGNPLNPLDLDTMLYFGLVVEALDQHQVIPVFMPDREEFLEYDITRMIWQVLHPEKKTIGILSSLPVMGMAAPPPMMMMMMREQPAAQPPWMFVNELKKTYNVVPVTTNMPGIPPAVSLLMVIHPNDLPDSALYAIDQFVLRGGRLMVFVDPMCNIDAKDPGFGMRMPGNSSLNRLLEAWGARVEDGKVVFDVNNPTTLNDGQGGAQKHPAWISVSGDMFNRNDIVSSPVNIMLLPAAGRIMAAGTASNTIIPLISSSTNAVTKDALSAMSGMMAVVKDFTPLGEPLIMAAKISGVFKSAFPAGTTANGLTIAQSPNTVIVIADVDMLADPFNVREVEVFGQKVYQPLNNNIDFVLNAVDQLSGDDNLISLRSRAKSERPFTVVKGLEQKAQEEWLGIQKKLTEELDAVNARLGELQAKKDESQRYIISAEQKQELDEFNKKKIEISRKLREVLRNQNREINALGAVVKACNIVAVPALVCLAGIALALYRHYKVKQT